VTGHARLSGVLIVGLRIIWKTLRSGTFHCPQERADHPYLVQEARRFLALFFIPIIPLGKAGQAVRCESCKARFPVSVLDQPTAVDRTEQMTLAVRSVVVAMVAAGDATDTAVRAHAVNVVTRSGTEYTDDKLSEDLRLLPVHDVQSVIAQTAGSFDDPAKERLVDEIAGLALSRNELSVGERRVLDALAAGLGMTPAHLRGVLAGE
jgi:hypothetical protein